MTPGELWRRVLFLGRRRRMTQELEEEIRLHLALRANKLSEQGFDSREAGYAAQKQFGNKTLVEEVSREMWGWIAVERFFAGCSLRRAIAAKECLV